MIGLFRHATGHVAQVRRQHVGNACEYLRGKRERTGRNCKVRMNDIRAPVSGFSQDRTKAGRQIKGHFGHTAGVFSPAKGFGAQDFYLVMHLTPRKMAHACRKNAYAMPAAGQARRHLVRDSSSASADRRIFVAENEDLHRERGSSPRHVLCAQPCQPLTVTQLAPEIETFIGTA